MDKKDLEKLLEFVLEVVELPGNEWAKHRLIYRLNPKRLVVDDVTDKHLKSKVSLIERYLNIDVNILIDYKDFDKPVQEQLFRDCLEMNRFHKGTANHRVNFEEFCRYAHLQAEEMINYYFVKVSSGDIEKTIKHIQKVMSFSQDEKKPFSEVYQIAYAKKIKAIGLLLTLDRGLLDILYFLNDFRNEASHRCSLSANKDDEYLQLFVAKGLNTGYIKIGQLTQEDKNIYNRGLYIRKKRSQDFNSVYTALERLKNIIIEKLKQLQ